MNLDFSEETSYIENPEPLKLACHFLPKKLLFVPMNLLKTSSNAENSFKKRSHVISWGTRCIYYTDAQSWKKV